MKYTIWTRYEMWTKNGKEFTRWFLSYGNPFFDNEEDAIIEINDIVNCVEKCNYII